MRASAVKIAEAAGAVRLMKALAASVMAFSGILTARVLNEIVLFITHDVFALQTEKTAAISRCKYIMSELLRACYDVDMTAV